MKVIKVLILFLVITATIFSQTEEKTKKNFFWKGELIASYLPELYSNYLETTSIGGQISFVNNNNNTYISFVANNYFVPTALVNNLDFTSVKNIGTTFSYNLNLNTTFSAGINYTNGKISNITKKFASLNLQGIYFYKIGNNLNLFANLGGVYNMKDSIVTPSLRIGFITNFIRLSFNLNQYYSWDNLAERTINSMALPNPTFLSQIN